MASKTEPFAVWITGLPACGKSTITACLRQMLAERGVQAEVLESDELRKILGGGYGEADRETFYRRMVWIATMLIRHGVSVIFDATANRRQYRDAARRQIGRFFEVFVDVPLEVCMARDPKGIYRSAAEGKASDVPGLQAAYEPPENPDLTIDGVHEYPLDAAQRIIALFGLP